MRRRIRVAEIHDEEGVTVRHVALGPFRRVHRGFAGRMGVEMAQTHRSPTEGMRVVSSGSVSQRKTFMRRPAALPVDGYGATGIVVQDTRMPSKPSLFDSSMKNLVKSDGIRLS